MTRALASFAFALLPVATLVGQSQPHFVLTELAGNPAAQVVAVDPVLGTSQSIGSFPSDALAPLAITIDHYDGDLFVALDEGNGSSRIVRLQRSGSSYTEVSFATIVGRVVDMAVAVDRVVVAVDDANGGLFSAPRRGGAFTQLLQQANVTAMNLVGLSGAVVAWTGRAGTSQLDSGMGVLGLNNQQWWWWPASWPNPAGREITGVVDLPTAIPRQILSFDDGALELYSSFTPGQVLMPVPAIPPGGATAMHPRGLYSTEPAVLGNANHPLLYALDPWSASVMGMSLALPGSPVDFAHALPQDAHHWNYGFFCGPQRLEQSQASPAELGGVLTLQVGTQNTPFLPVFFIAGLSDYALGQLPAVLPGGCELQVSPDVVTFEIASALGDAQKAIAVPSSTSLVGTVVHTQWAHIGGAGFSVSNAIANWLGY